MYTVHIYIYIVLYTHIYIYIYICIIFFLLARLGYIWLLYFQVYVYVANKSASCLNPFGFPIPGHLPIVRSCQFRTDQIQIIHKISCWVILFPIAI